MGGSNYIDLTGQRFGRLTVLGRADDHITAKGYKHVMWHCVCDCGNKKVVRGKSLRGGVTTSCGCFRSEHFGESARKHGGYGTRLYAIWNSMRQRCNNPAHSAYKNYGGRGIKICHDWDEYDTFRRWAYETGYRDEADRGELTLDRIDVDADYTPENCRWADMRRQATNRRSSIIIEHNGESHPLSVWAELTGEKYCTLWARYRRGKPVFSE